MPKTKCGFNDVPGAKGTDLLQVWGPTLLVDIGFDPQFQTIHVGTTIPRPAVSGVRALVDTGASFSCIDSELAIQLALPIIDRQKISGVGGLHEVNVHLAQIHVPTLGFTIYGQFSAVNLQKGGQPHQALIGRFFLQKFTMIYNGPTGDVELFS